MRQALDEGRPDYEMVRQLITVTSSSLTNQPALENVKVILPLASQFDRLWRAGDGTVLGNDQKLYP